MKFLLPLLLFLPITIAGELLHWPPIVLFVTAALAIIPLAGLLGAATEGLAHHAGARIGGLLNATFGNAAELIITIAALQAGLVDVVKASITGSIIGNLLLVLGASILVGGVRNGVQRFSKRTANTGTSLMTVAVIGLAVPTFFGPGVATHGDLSVQELNLGIAVALMLGYVLSVIFAFTAPPDSITAAPEPAGHAVRWSFRVSLAILALSVVAMVYLSEALVGTIEPVLETSGLSPLFVGVIVIPIIGNAAEHAAAIQVAYRNQMELALGISMGSSMQVALFVAPLLVFISVLLGKPMTLAFSSLELSALGIAVIIASLIALDAETNWLEGALLLIVYAILAFGFFFV